MRAVWVRTTRPSRSANSEMNSSGRLPSADWRMPVVAGPKWLPRLSVPSPTRPASPASVSAATMKISVSDAPATRRPAVRTIPAIEIPIMTSAVRPSMATMPAGGWACVSVIGSNVAGGAVRCQCASSGRAGALDLSP